MPLSHHILGCQLCHCNASPFAMYPRINTHRSSPFFLLFFSFSLASFDVSLPSSLIAITPHPHHPPLVIPLRSFGIQPHPLRYRLDLLNWIPFLASNYCLTCPAHYSIYILHSFSSFSFLLCSPSLLRTHLLPPLTSNGLPFHPLENTYSS